MSDRSLIKLTALAMVILAVFFVIETREQSRYRAESAAALLKIEERQNAIDREITEMQVSIADLQKNSVKAVVDRANEAVVDGFSSMMGALTRELGSLSELMQEQLQEQLPPEESGAGPAEPPAKQPAD